MERHQVIPRTCCMIVNDQNEILFIKFSELKGKVAGFYDFPGGHIEKAEGIIHTAEREIFEETGLSVTDTKLRGVIHVTNFFGKKIMLFITKSVANGGELKESDEGTLHWIKSENIAEYKMFEDMKLIIPKLLESGDSVFTAVSVFDDSGKMIEWHFE